MIYQNLITLHNFLSKVKGTLNFVMYTNTMIGSSKIRTLIGTYRFSNLSEDEGKQLVDVGTSNEISAESIDTKRLQLNEFFVDKRGEICIVVENCSEANIAPTGINYRNTQSNAFIKKAVDQHFDNQKQTEGDTDAVG